MLFDEVSSATSDDPYTESDSTFSLPAFIIKKYGYPNTSDMTVSDCMRSVFKYCILYCMLAV